MKTIEEQILDTLRRQEFADWFTEDRGGRFDLWISSFKEAPSKEEILQDIARLFHTDLLVKSKVGK
jgi:hypothetical protein